MRIGAEPSSGSGGTANLKELQKNAVKKAAEAYAGRRNLDYKTDPAAATKVHALSSENRLHKVELKKLRQESEKLSAQETGMMAQEVNMIRLSELLSRVIDNESLTDEELANINAEKDKVLNNIDSVTENTKFKGEELLNLGTEELGLKDFEFSRVVTEEEAVAKATAFMSAPEKIRAAQAAVEKGIKEVEDMAWGVMCTLNYLKGKDDDTRSEIVEKLVLFYKTTGGGGKRGVVSDQIDVGGQTLTEILQNNGADPITIANGWEWEGVSDKDIEDFADELKKKIKKGYNKSGKNREYGYGNGLLRKHVYNFSISVALKNLGEDYKSFRKAVENSIYNTEIAKGKSADENMKAVSDAVLGTKKNTQGLYVGGSFGVDKTTGKLSAAVSDDVIKKAKEDAQKSLEQRRKIEEAVGKYLQEKSELLAKQDEVDYKIKAVQDEISLNNDKISSLEEIDPEDAKMAMMRWFMGMFEFYVSLQNKLHTSMQFSRFMIGTLEDAYGVGQQDGRTW